MARAGLALLEHLSLGAPHAISYSLTCRRYFFSCLSILYRITRLPGDYRPAVYAMWLSTTKILLPCVSLLLPSLSLAQCPLYQNYAAHYHEPYTEGTWNLSYARPIIPCRTFRSQQVEDTIERLRGVIKDVDLFRVRAPPLCCNSC